ncbi:hypothetical protein PQX77_003472 [Marasmius sp. AFHP31]|nr:hypothetical protein PQX77_003472 [Marasmius sp. AFHP31]
MIPLKLFLTFCASIATVVAQNSPVVVCVAGQCLAGFSNTTIGTTISGAPTSVLLLPGQYSDTTNPQFLHDLLTSSESTLAPSAGFENSTSSRNLPLNLALSPGLAIYSQSLYGGTEGFSSLPSTPVVNSSTPIQAGSMSISSNTWASLTIGSDSQRVIVWDSIPDVSQLPVTGFTTADNGTLCAKCSPGFFLTSNGDCKACQLGCSACADGNGVCQTCKPGFTLDGNDKTKCNALQSVTNNGTVCPDGSFGNGARCQLCSPSCRTCRGATSNDCVICAAESYAFNGGCVAADGNGVCQGTKLIADNNKNACDACGAKCTSCAIPNFSVASTVDQLQCTGCLPGSFLSQGKCVESCPQGTFVDPKDNVTCSVAVSAHPPSAFHVLLPLLSQAQTANVPAPVPPTPSKTRPPVAVPPVTPTVQHALVPALTSASHAHATDPFWSTDVAFLPAARTNSSTVFAVSRAIAPVPAVPDLALTSVSRALRRAKSSVPVVASMRGVRIVHPLSRG